MKTESRHHWQEAAVMSMLSRLFAAADGASGKEFDEAFRVRVVGASSASSNTKEEGGDAIIQKSNGRNSKEFYGVVQLNSTPEILVWDLSNIMCNTSIFGVKSSWTSLYFFSIFWMWGLVVPERSITPNVSTLSSLSASSCSVSELKQTHRCRNHPHFPEDTTYLWPLVLLVRIELKSLHPYNPD